MAHVASCLEFFRTKFRSQKKILPVLMNDKSEASPLGKYSSRMLVQKFVRLSRDFRWCCSFPLGSLHFRMGAKWPKT